MGSSLPEVSFVTSLLLGGIERLKEASCPSVRADIIPCWQQALPISALRDILKVATLRLGTGGKWKSKQERKVIFPDVKWLRVFINFTLVGIVV